jgi:hypothetical protein
MDSGTLMNRTEILSSLKTQSPEVFIIGAGINGDGTFRGLAVNDTEFSPPYYWIKEPIDLRDDDSSISHEPIQ